MSESSVLICPDFNRAATYVREMQRYGVLPSTLPPNAPVDPYQTDRVRSAVDFVLLRTQGPLRGDVWALECNAIGVKAGYARP